MIKEMYFESRDCAEWFLKNHAPNVYVMAVHTGKNEDDVHITIDILDMPNILVSVAGATRRRIYE